MLQRKLRLFCIGIVLFLGFHLVAFSSIYRDLPRTSHRIKELRKELRKVEKELRKIERAKKRQARTIQHFQTKHFGQNKISRESKLALHKKSPLGKTSVLNRFRTDSLHKDTNQLKVAIQLCEMQCARGLEELAQNKSSFFEQSKRFMSIPSTNKLDRRRFIKQQKEAYYLRELLNRQAKDLGKQIKLQSFQQQLQSAQAQQAKLLSQLSKPNFQLPPGYQTRSKVHSQLPQQAGLPNANVIKEKAFQLNAVIDSAQSLQAKDSLWFKPNPYKSLLWKDRVKPIFSWQTNKTQNYLPAQLQTYMGFNYLLSPRFSPIFTFSHSLGLGYGLNQIQLSHEAYGFQAGTQGKCYRRIFLQCTYEANFRKVQGEEKSYYKFSPECVLGIGIKAKPTLFIGCNLLQLIHKNSTHPFVVRFTL